MSYLQTLPGMLKILIIILNILVFFCVAIGGPGYYAGWFFLLILSVLLDIECFKKIKRKHMIFAFIQPYIPRLIL
jgi:hypothetical protein